ncbi:serine hydrolase domain-containing protein [Acidobacteriota bacterium]
MKFKVSIFLIVFILVLGLASCKVPTEKEFDKKLSDKLQTALQDALENPDNKFPGAVLYVSGPGIEAWAGAAGLSNVETAMAMRPDNQFRAASILKPFVAVVILQLVEEGRFSLDDVLLAVLPENVTTKFSGSNKITVRMLMSHTSGIPDWLTDAMMGEIVADPQRIWKVDEYFDVAAAQEPYFPPGEGWQYSNTNYNLLSLVIEQATGSTWREEIRERILTPLDLENTQLPEPGDLSVSDYHARGYVDMGGRQMDFTLIDSSMAGAAGGHALITTTSDLARFLKAVLADKLFKKVGTLDEMLTFVDPPDDAEVIKYAVGYGLGMMKYLLPGNVEMLGHAGSTGGFESFVYHLPAKNITISGMMNSMETNQYQILLPALEILLPELSTQH